MASLPIANCSQCTQNTSSDLKRWVVSFLTCVGVSESATLLLSNAPDAVLIAADSWLYSNRRVGSGLVLSAVKKDLEDAKQRENRGRPKKRETAVISEEEEEAEEEEEEDLIQGLDMIELGEYEIDEGQDGEEDFDEELVQIKSLSELYDLETDEGEETE